jgi:hypothetical protein
VLRLYFGSVRHGKPPDPGVFVEGYRRKLTRRPGLEDTLSDIALINAMWRQDPAGQPDWRDTTDAYGLPGQLDQIATDVGDARDQHLGRCVVYLLGDGRRVFVTMGSAHAEKIESALRQTIGA